MTSRQRPSVSRSRSRAMAGLEVLSQSLDLVDGNDRHEPQEEKKEEGEETEGAGEQAPIHPGRRVEMPTRRQEVGVERGDDENETFEPHPDQDADREDEERQRVPAE